MSREPLTGASQELAGSNHRALDQYDALKKRLDLANLGFWVACIVGPFWSGVVIAMALVIRPDEFSADAISIIVPVLALILVVPLYRIRRDYQQRVRIARAELEKQGSLSLVDQAPHDRTSSE